MKHYVLLIAALALSCAVKAQTYTSQAGNAVSLSNTASIRMESATGITALAPATALTVEAWVRVPCCQSTENTIVSFGDGTANTYTLSVGSFGPRLVLRNGAAAYTDIRRTAKPDALDLNRDYHVAVTWSAAAHTAVIYIDGFRYYVNDTVAAGSLFYTTGSKLVVGATSNLSQPFNGKIDELRIWNTALNQADIRANMNRRLAGNETGLMACYHFDEAAGSTTAADATTTGAQLTAYNFGMANRSTSTATIPSKLAYDTYRIQNAAWTNERRIARGITSRYKIFDTLFDNKVSVTIMDIDLAQADVDLRIANLPANTNAALAKMKTSEIMRKYGAIAAVNGNYYNTGSPYGGATFVREHGATTVQTNAQHGVGYPDDKALVFNDNATTSPQIIRRPLPNQQTPSFVSGWAGYTGFDNVMSTGPDLLTAGNITYEYIPMDISHEGPSGRGPWTWHMSAYPFTAVGLTATNHLILAVGDGKFAGSGGPAGISCPNLAHFMKALGCTDAMKLDGGGSSTMTIEGATYNDVVNYPSDNGIFDHEGERANPNALLLVPRNKRGSGTALYFDGVNNKVVITDSLSASPSGSFTVEGWGKIDAGATNTDELINKNENTTTRKGYYIEYNNLTGKLSAGIGRTNNTWGTVTSGTPAWVANQWHHFAMTYNEISDTLKLYIDGQSMGSAYVPDPVFSTRPLCLGGSDAYPANGLKGALDEVRFWNKELTNEALKQGMHRNADTADVNLTAYYKMDDFYIGTVKDYSTYHRNGLATGGMSLHNIIASYAPIADARFDALQNLAANWSAGNNSGDTALSWQAPFITEMKYLLHATDRQTGDTTAGIPFGITKRLKQRWLLDKFGITTEPLTLTFQKTGLAAGVLDSSRQYYLLFAADGQQFNPLNAIPATLTGTTLTFTDIDIQEGWYTLGWQPAQRSALPGNQAFRFDGASGIVRVPGFGNPTGNFSIELWARPDAGGSGDDALINANENASGRKGYFIEYGYSNSATPGLKAGIGQTNNTWATALYSTANWQPGQWHHVVMTYDTASRKIDLYQDGLPVATTTLSVDTAVYSSRPMAIGGSDYYSGNGFKGAIDEVRIWNKVLTPEEIVSRMHLEVSPAATGLKGYFQLDSLGAANSVVNAVAGGSNGIASAAVTAASVITSYAPVEQHPVAGFTSYSANWWVRNTVVNKGLSLQTHYNSEPVFLLHASNNQTGHAPFTITGGAAERLNRAWKMHRQGLGIGLQELQFNADSLNIATDSMTAVYLLWSADNISYQATDSLTTGPFGSTLNFQVTDTLNGYITLGLRRRTYIPPTGTGPGLSGANDLQVYPNPVSEILHISYDTKTGGRLAITVFDITGKQIISGTTDSAPGNNHYQLNTAALLPGYYSIQISTGNGIRHSRFVKQ